MNKMDIQIPKLLLLSVLNMLISICAGHPNIVDQVFNSTPTFNLAQLPMEPDESPFFKMLINRTDQLNSGILTMHSLKQLLLRSNEKCLDATKLTSDDDKMGFTEKEFVNASYIIAYFLQVDATNGTCNRTDKISSSSMAKSMLFPNFTVCPESLSALLSKIIAKGKYVEDNETNQCFIPRNLLSECTSDSSVIGEAMKNLISSVLSGFCILPEPNYFQQKLFSELDLDKTGYINEKEFEMLLHKFLSNNDNGQDDDYQDQAEGKEHYAQHEDSHTEQKQTASNTLPETLKRSKRNAQVHENKCYSVKDLFVIAGDEHDQEGKLVLSQQGLQRISPAVLQQFYSGSCDSVDKNKNNTEISEYTTAMKYGYGTLSVFLISMLAFVGLILFPGIGSQSYQLIMQFFIALGVGTLSGDALLHLIPEILGLHDHNEDHEHGNGQKDNTHIYLMLLVLVGIYVFYLFENVLRLYNSMKGVKVSPHHHDRTENEHEGASSQHVIIRTSTTRSLPLKPNESLSENNNSDGETPKPANALCHGVTPVAIMVFIGDVLHNFGDGLALGVAFNSGWVSGVGTSIAIFCHELPHEFGDFAIYLKNGLSKWHAIGLNFVAACCSFIGLFIGLSVSENAEVRKWMLAMIAGMFLYISLVDVLHEVTEEKSKQHPLLQFFLQNLGLCLGWTILLLLSIYEETIIVVLNF